MARAGFRLSEARHSYEPWAAITSCVSSTLPWEGTGHPGAPWRCCPMPPLPGASKHRCRAYGQRLAPQACGCFPVQVEDVRSRIERLQKWKLLMAAPDEIASLYERRWRRADSSTTPRVVGSPWTGQDAVFAQ